jgi:hypothetical protein
MADDLATLFGIQQAPWTDWNSALAGGPGATPQAPPAGVTSLGVDPRTTRTPVAPGGATPPDSEAAGRSPRIVDRIPDQPPYQCSRNSHNAAMLSALVVSSGCMHRQILRGQLLYCFLASVELARRQYDLRLASWRQISNPIPRLPPVTTMIGLCSVMAVIPGAGV